VSRACNEFRSQLERSLAGKVETGELRRLGWHEHLLGCPDCRALMQSEEALELLLASLPEPKLPPEMAQRILARLREVRGAEVLARQAVDPLDALLDLDHETAPPDLARRVLAKLGRERGALASGAREAPDAAARLDERLDRLLDRALLAVDTPLGLAERVRARLRDLSPAPSLARRTGSGRLFLRLAAAVIVLVGAAGALWRALRPPSDATGVAKGSRASGDSATSSQGVSDELLASLDLLESWEALEATGAAPTDELALLEPADLVVLEVLAEAEREYGLAPEAPEGNGGK
jgi:hypothetical protein